MHIQCIVTLLTEVCFIDYLKNIFTNLGENTAVLESEQDAMLTEIIGENVFAVTRDQLCKIEK